MTNKKFPDMKYIQAARENARKLVEKYFDKHKVCPDCKSASLVNVERLELFMT